MKEKLIRCVEPLTVVHTNSRGCYFRYVKEPLPNIGYSAIVAYALGIDKPHYPVPAIPLTVWLDNDGTFRVH